MTFMFDPEPATPAPRVRLLHTHRGHILGLRVPGKPYLVLPSVPLRRRLPLPTNSILAARFALSLTHSLTAGVREQTGLSLFPASEDGAFAYPKFMGGGQDDLFSADGSMLFAEDFTVSGGTLHPNAGFFHPREWAGSPDADHLGALLTSDPPPLALEQVRVYPHEVVPGDIYNFPIVSTRYERNAHGEESVTFQYENYSGAALGKDDAFGEDGEEAPEGDGRGGRKRKVAERNTALGCAWGSPHDLRAQILVYRLGGDYRGEST